MPGPHLGSPENEWIVWNGMKPRLYLLTEDCAGYWFALHPFQFSFYHVCLQCRTWKAKNGISQSAVFLGSTCDLVFPIKIHPCTVELFALGFYCFLLARIVMEALIFCVALAEVPSGTAFLSAKEALLWSQHMQW